MFPANGKNVKLGKGALMLDMLDDDGASTGLQFNGNASAISLSSQIQSAELYSSTEHDSGLVAKQKTRIAYSLSATLNEYQMNNLKLFLLGEEETVAQTLGTASTITFTNVEPGRYYEVGARRITSVVVKIGVTAQVLNTDYQVNSEFGMIYVVPGGGIDSGDDIIVEFDKPALTLTKIKIGKAAAQIVRLVYVADDANTEGASSKDRLECWKVDVAPDGELGLISEDYGSFNLTFSVLSDSTNHPDEPYGKLERVTAVA